MPPVGITQSYLFLSCDTFSRCAIYLHFVISKQNFRVTVTYLTQIITCTLQSSWNKTRQPYKPILVKREEELNLQTKKTQIFKVITYRSALLQSRWLDLLRAEWDGKVRMSIRLNSTGFRFTDTNIKDAITRKKCFLKRTFFVTANNTERSKVEPRLLTSHHNEIFRTFYLIFLSCIV
jgi:hypothetical protein